MPSNTKKPEWFSKIPSHVWKCSRGHPALSGMCHQRELKVCDWLVSIQSWSELCSVTQQHWDKSRSTGKPSIIKYIPWCLLWISPQFNWQAHLMIVSDTNDLNCKGQRNLRVPSAPFFCDVRRCVSVDCRGFIFRDVILSVSIPSSFVRIDWNLPSRFGNTGKLIDMPSDVSCVASMQLKCLCCRANGGAQLSLTEPWL